MVEETAPPVAPSISIRCIVAMEAVRTSQDLSADAVAALVKRWHDALSGLPEATVASGAESVLASCPDTAAALGAVIEARRWAARSGHGAHYRAAMHEGLVGRSSVLIGIDSALCRETLHSAHAGQILVTGTCEDLVRRALPIGYVLRDVGERRLKACNVPMRLYELAEGSEPADAPTQADGHTPGAIRLLLVEDDRMLREALASLLRLDPEFDLVGTAPNGRRGVDLALALKPDVALMDIEMPEMNGIEATRRIRQAMPETQVLILTKFGDDESVFEAIRAGALGYMLKDAGIDEIGRVVRAIHRREGYISPALVPRVMQEFARISRAGEETRALYAELSRREIEVLELLGAGMRNRAIADKLFISEKTVKNHISSILAKLQVNDRTAAALIARDHGLGRSSQ